MGDRIVLIENGLIYWPRTARVRHQDAAYAMARVQATLTA